MSDIKPGDVVELKSGSPKMVVTQVPSSDGGPHSVELAWFNEATSEFATGYAPVVALVKRDT